MQIPELLAPAGGRAALNAAVRAGADAVYLGLDKLNARMGADNFTLDTLEEACNYAHLRGVSIYITVNTLVLPDELQDAAELVRQAYRRGADAFIVQDLGLAAEVSRSLPADALHISTQMNIHSEDGMRAAAELGASRVTLARELSLEEIAHLARVGEELGVEVEVFAHGAICVCYSGQCLMSSMIGGRSANRGACAQACRLPYSLVNMEDSEREMRAPGEFLLSPKDMCTAERLADLANAGVASLKIEGRMKSPEYVFSVVKVYRRLLDELALAAAEDGVAAGVLVTYEDKESLGSVFSRGFTDAYLDGKSDDELMGYKRPNNRGQLAGRVKSFRDGQLVMSSDVDLEPGDLLEAWTRKGNVRLQVPDAVERAKRSVQFEVDDPHVRLGTGDRIFRIRSAAAAFHEDMLLPKVPVAAEVWLQEGRPLRMQFTPANAGDAPQELDCSGSAEGAVVEAARTRPVTEEDVREHVGRMGSTPFALADMTLHMDAGVGIGFSALHKCRTAALEALEESMLQPWRDRHLPKMSHRDRPNGSSHRRHSCLICALCTSPETARAAKRTGADVIYVPAMNFQHGGAEVAGVRSREASQTGYPKGCIVDIPSVERGAFDAWKNVPEDGAVMVSSLGALWHAAHLGCSVDVGPKLPLTNADALRVSEAFGAERVWLSPELTLNQMHHLANASNMQLGVKVYGAQELMVTEHCMLQSQGPCDEDCQKCPRRRTRFGLKDRKGYIFPVVTDDAGRCHLYNSVTLDVVHELPELLASGITMFMVDATLMDVEQTAQAVGRVKHALKLALDGTGAVSKMPHTTSGHLHRGIS